MNIKYLGTGSSEGTPSLFCECKVCKNARTKKGKNLKSRTGILINEELLIDLSPDLFHYVANDRLHLSKVHNIIITHSHSDHLYTASLEFHSKCYVNGGFVNKLNIYGNQFVKSQIEKLYSKNNDYNINCFSITNEQDFFCGKYKIKPIKVNHMETEDSFIFLIYDGKSTYLHILDSPFLDKETLNVIKSTKLKIDLVTMDCTFGLLNEKFYGHMNLYENIELKKQLTELEMVTKNTKWVATHLSHYSGSNHYEVSKVAKKNGILLAYDNLFLKI